MLDFFFIQTVILPHAHLVYSSKISRWQRSRSPLAGNIAAKNVLENKTKEYKNHPQLNRFRQSKKQ
jgi:hypothetical protein